MLSVKGEIFMRVLLVEDDPKLNHSLKYQLEKENFIVDSCSDGEEALFYIDQNIHDVILLDRMLPLLDGTEILTLMRRKNNSTPVILITALGTLNDKITGLDLGADDYLTKPFEIIELLARVETVLRRYHKTENILTVHDLVIDTSSRIVKRDGDPINLTKKEYELLLLFVRNKNVALYRETIYERIWGGEYMGDSRTVDLHVQRMRKKIGWEDKIVTVYKVGYRLEG